MIHRDLDAYIARCRKIAEDISSTRTKHSWIPIVPIRPLFCTASLLSFWLQISLITFSFSAVQLIKMNNLAWVLIWIVVSKSLN